MKHFLTYLLLGLAAIGVRAEIIPATNAPAAVWAGAGVPGGIPARTAIYTTLNPGATASQIQSAINACPPNQVVKLNAGTYNISAPLTVGTKDNWTLRGAGMGQTILKFSGSTGPALNIGNGFGWTDSVAITSGGTQGSTNVTVSTAGSYATGSLVAIDEVNSGWIASYGCGADGTQKYNVNQIGKNSSSADRSQVHYARVVGVAGNTITFWPPLPYDLEAGRSPQISRAATRGCHNSGIEDLTIDFSQYSGTYPSRFQGVTSFWLKNVEMFGWDNNFGIWFVRGASAEVRGCYIHNPRGYGIDHGYGILCDGLSGSLIIDNIIYECMSNFILQNGCTANVIAYNVSAFGKYINGGYTGEWLLHEISGNHTPFPAYNLFEGNYTGQLQSDYYYGPSGWGTIFRNRIPGNSSATTQHRLAVSIDAMQRNYSVVGNQLGERTAPNSITLALPGVTRTYARPGTITWGYDPGSASFSSAYIYRLGYPYSGNNSTGGGTAVQDSFVKNNTLRHGNWDAANNAVVWDSSIADHNIPNSLFLTSKPSWFGSLAWPPYGPSAPTSVSSDLAKIPAGYRLLNNANPPTSGNQAPTAVAAATTATTGVAPFAVSFSSAGSSDPEGATITYSWSFGDGNSSTAANPSHTYTSSGSYVARLTVSDGTNSSLSSPITITTRPSPGSGVSIPRIIIAAPQKGAVPLSVGFSAGTDWASSNSLSFGDGSMSANPNVTHIYSSAGSYSVTVYSMVSGVSNHITTYINCITATNAP